MVGQAGSACPARLPHLSRVRICPPSTGGWVSGTGYARRLCSAADFELLQVARADAGLLGQLQRAVAVLRRGACRAEPRGRTPLLRRRPRRRTPGCGWRSGGRIDQPDLAPRPRIERRPAPASLRLDAVDDGKVHRPGANQVDGDARNTVAELARTTGSSGGVPSGGWRLPIWNMVSAP